MGFEKKINNPKEDSSRSDGGDAGSVVTTSSPVPKVKVKSMAIMMIKALIAFSSTISGFSVYALRYKSSSG
jgi:hypothetical protein